MNPQDESLPHTIFSTFDSTRGYRVLKSTLDTCPDVLGALRAMNSHNVTTCESARSCSKSQEALTRHSTKDRKVLVQPGSGHPASRPETVLGWTGNRSSSPAFRIAGRREDQTEVTPGPGSYHITETGKAPLGTICREPKFKDSKGNISLGPGTYDPIRASTGQSFRFPRHTSPNPSLGGITPGPGSYQGLDRASLGLQFSISKAASKLALAPSDRLGPGCYGASRPQLESTSVRFASAPRFPIRGIIDYQPRHRTLTKEEKEAMKQRIAANCDLESSKSDIRREILARKSAQKAVKMTISRMAKSGLLQSIKFRRQQALEDKFRRFEWRMHREEVRETQKHWITVAVFASSLTIAFMRFSVRKVLHAKTKKALRFLARISRVVGRLSHNLKTFRMKRALQRIARAVPRMRRWLRARKVQYHSLIVALCEKTATQDIIFQLMTRWLWRLRKVQKAIKSFLIGRRLFYVRSKMNWALVEVSLHKASAKVRTFATELLEGKATIPDKIKEYYIRICIQKKLIRYFFEVRNYKRACKEAQSDFEARCLDREAERVLCGLAHLPQEELVLPPAPVLVLQLTKEDFKTLIVEAEKNRLNWDKIEQHVEQPLDRRRPSKAVVASYNDRRRSKVEFRARSPTVN